MRACNCLRRGFYRSRRGWIFGVCRGFADFIGISALWIRAALVLLVYWTGFFPFGLAYLVLGLILGREPRERHSEAAPPRSDEACQTASAARTPTMRRAQERLEQRLRNLESVVTSREFDWGRRMDG